MKNYHRVIIDNSKAYFLHLDTEPYPSNSRSSIVCLVFSSFFSIFSCGTFGNFTVLAVIIRAYFSYHKVRLSYRYCMANRPYLQ